MTIHQLKAPCWLLDPSPWRDEDPGNPHYGSRDEALRTLAAVREERDGDQEAIAHLAKVEPLQAADACWVAKCAAPDCGEELYNHDEGWTIHASSLPDLEASMTVWEWKVSDGKPYCPDDAPEGAEIPPPSPAELEAAGQMRLPGVAC